MTPELMMVLELPTLIPVLPSPTAIVPVLMIVLKSDAPMPTVPAPLVMTPSW